ncbi:MAG: SH3 domain-containing protein [Ferruginibacter sp.]|nr:SH3 domain-containing protein [Chitinophagaceae bacterium]
MDYAIVSVPAAPVRRKPMHRKEMVNQLLFGETVKVLKSKNELWVKIRSLHDNYEGWMTNTMLEAIDEDTATTRSSAPATCSTRGSASDSRPRSASPPARTRTCSGPKRPAWPKRPR